MKDISIVHTCPGIDGWGVGMDSYKYIELTFYGKHAGIIKKINWSDWHREVDDTRLLMTSNERVLFLYDADDIKYYWKKI